MLSYSLHVPFFLMAVIYSLHLLKS
ncbi:hypothetical protein NC652_033469 [Populus alba x Populus x berolinensis]|uniref:Uncharacterized protein n=1 Tax=Populus alba x Populus x berolinensis TaxID=444605 RepID=A0AAD6LTQ9_9ROSI|nr:hypothetical protein NC651_032449 [Populus alba x Populus x berolinensis]KAJ6880117.1 hypothetical protein NC652_033453 [Populus alba x Populus x berolinensis]KAJ6880134.1 hypothetical protein NC652_033469 [Populus alba x Populus x berolinensis]KAJ6973077.1 hypothetical protein NC653_033422 [Populus alba x Populus x berolinensis]